MCDDILSILKDRKLGMSIDISWRGKLVRIVESDTGYLVASYSYLPSVTIEDAIRKTVEWLPK